MFRFTTFSNLLVEAPEGGAWSRCRQNWWKAGVEQSEKPKTSGDKSFLRVKDFLNSSLQYKPEILKYVNTAIASNGSKRDLPVEYKVRSSNILTMIFPSDFCRWFLRRRQVPQVRLRTGINAGLTITDLRFCQSWNKIDFQWGSRANIFKPLWVSSPALPFSFLLLFTVLPTDGASFLCRS